MDACGFAALASRTSRPDRVHVRPARASAAASAWTVAVTERCRIDWLGTLCRGGAVGGHPLREPRRDELRLGRAVDARGDLRQRGAARALPARRGARRGADRAALSFPGNATFRTTSAIGFVIGFALFGSVTFIPIYSQLVKGYSATASGLLLTPAMLGVLVTSTASGFPISRYGSYRRFPRAGTALAAVALYLLSTPGAGTPGRAAGLYMLFLGLGLGLAK